MSRFTFAIATLFSLITAAIATFDPTSNSNVAIYWGQGPDQARLVETCMNPNVDIVILAFVNVFPDNEGSGGYPGTNFGNACYAGYYTNKTGGETQLLDDCPYIGPDITTCQETYGKKVFISLGGAYPLNYFIGNNAQAVKFAKFMWGAFGPQTDSWVANNNPRPFGNASVDGFDFDIESDTSPVPTWNGKDVNNYKTRGYAKMIQTFKNVLFPKDTSKDYYISGAPQCIVPDAHLGPVVKQAWFDFLFIQFYNTPECSARAGVNYIEGNDTSENISYDTWANVSFYNPDVKLYIGLPASTSASGSSDYYLPPADAKTLLKQYVDDDKFGGVMLWEATYGADNVVCGKNYPTWMKRILTALSKGKKVNTVTDDCPDSGETCGTCPTIPVSKNGHCGANYGTTCSGSTFGSCCTADGTCSSDTSSCSSSCDSSFSDCSSSSKFLFKRQAVYSNSSTVSSSATIVSSSTILSSSSSIESSSSAVNTTSTASTATAVYTVPSNGTTVDTTATVTADATAVDADTTTAADETTADATVAATADATTASSSAADPTAEVISSTMTSTIYQTVYITTVISDVTSTMTVVEPVTTEIITTIYTTVTPTPAVVVTTVTSVIIEHITSTVSALPSTSTVTDYQTVSVEYASGASPSSSSSSLSKVTSTLSLTVTDTITYTYTVPGSSSNVTSTMPTTTTSNTTVLPTTSAVYSYTNTTVSTNTTTPSVVVQYVTVLPIAADAVASSTSTGISASYQVLAAQVTSSAAASPTVVSAAPKLASAWSWTLLLSLAVAAVAL